MKAILIFSIFISSQVIPQPMALANGDNSCPPRVAEKLLTNHLPEIEPAAVQELLSLQLEGSDILAQIKSLRRLDEMQREIKRAWQSRLVEIIYPRPIPATPKELHPLDKFIGRADDFFALPENEQQAYFQKYPDFYDAYQKSGAKFILALRSKHSLLTRELESKLKQDPKKRQKIIDDVASGKTRIEDESLDALFGIRFDEVERTVIPSDYPGQIIWHSPTRGSFLTPYEYISLLYHQIALTESDVVYDLGAGYGRVLFYGAHLHPKTTFKGVELVVERAVEIERLSTVSKLKNIHVINKSVLDVDLSDGSVFYFFNPFPPIMDQVVKKLEIIGTQRKIRIASLGNSTPHFERASWLKKINTRGPITIFESFPK